MHYSGDKMELQAVSITLSLSSLPFLSYLPLFIVFVVVLVKLK